MKKNLLLFAGIILCFCLFFAGCNDGTPEWITESSGFKSIVSPAGELGGVDMYRFTFSNKSSVPVKITFDWDHYSGGNWSIAYNHSETLTSNGTPFVVEQRSNTISFKYYAAGDVDTKYPDDPDKITFIDFAGY